MEKSFFRFGDSRINLNDISCYWGEVELFWPGSSSGMWVSMNDVKKWESSEERSWAVKMSYRSSEGFGTLTVESRSELEKLMEILDEKAGCIGEDLREKVRTEARGATTAEKTGVL